MRARSLATDRRARSEHRPRLRARSESSAAASPWCHRHHRPIGGSGAGQAHRRWKMCDGWPAGPAPSRFYSTPIGTDPDPYPSLLLLGARLALRLHDDACGAVRERARATKGDTQVKVARVRITEAGRRVLL